VDEREPPGDAPLGCLSAVVGAATLNLMYAVVNRLQFREPITDSVLESAQHMVTLVVEVGGLAARVARVDDTTLLLLLDFRSEEDAGRISRDVGGPWMREHVLPLLAGGTERFVGEVVASASATS
jgi:hypothetical protein